MTDQYDTDEPDDTAKPGRYIPGAEVAEIGRKLWGDKWEPQMARSFGTHISTVYRWRDGQVRVPAFVGLLSRYLIEQRAAFDDAEAMILRYR